MFYIIKVSKCDYFLCPILYKYLILSRLSQGEQKDLLNSPPCSRILPNKTFSNKLSSLFWPLLVFLYKTLTNMIIFCRIFDVFCSTLLTLDLEPLIQGYPLGFALLAGKLGKLSNTNKTLRRKWPETFKKKKCILVFHSILKYIFITI